jgi:hypothetical protein
MGSGRKEYFQNYAIKKPVLTTFFIVHKCRLCIDVISAIIDMHIYILH